MVYECLVGTRNVKITVSMFTHRPAGYMYVHIVHVHVYMYVICTVVRVHAIHMCCNRA